MTVFVDRLFNASSSNSQAAHHGRKWCHMTCDGDLDELHEMAEKIGMQRSWFQNKGSIPHYDLVASKRFLAIRNGAIETTTKELSPITRWWWSKSRACDHDWNKLQKPYEIYKREIQ